MSLYDLEVEKDFLGILLNNPDVWGEIHWIAEKDFSQPHRPFFVVIKQQLENHEKVLSTVLISERIKSYNIDLKVDAYDYIESLKLRTRLSEKTEILPILKELKRLTVRRELIQKCEEAQKKLREDKSLDAEGMVGVVTNSLTSVNTDFYKSGETEDLMDGTIEMIEERGENEKEDLGYVGVLPSIDKTIGPLIHPGSFCNISARSGVGKSSLGFFYSSLTAELHENIYLLWLDAGEMTKEQLQFRATCCLSKGRVPLWALRSGVWRKNKEWVDIIRGDVWPRVRGLIQRIDYRSVGGLSPKEKVNLMRRHYYRKVPKDGFLCIVDDYLKGMESLNRETKEYQAIGYYASDVKSLVTEEINGGFMTFTQSNRTGISKGKKASEIVDNDSVISISDRIKDNCTTNFLMRFKVMEELAKEENKFGNILLKNLKTRDGLGRDFESFIRPIKLSNGQFAEDYFNLDYHNFYFKDKGLYSEMLNRLGQVTVDLSTGQHEVIL